MQNIVLSDVLLVICSSLFAFFVAKAMRPARTKLGAVVAVAFPCLLLIYSQYLWSSTGKGLLEHATCVVTPESRSCVPSETGPSEDIVDWTQADYDELVKKSPDNICNRIFFDVQKGTVNGLPIDASLADIRSKFPCNVLYDPPEKMNRGGGLFYNDQSMYWYTFIEPRRFEIGRLGKTDVLQSTRVVGLSEAQVRRKLTGRWMTKEGSLLLEKPWGCMLFDIHSNIVISLAAFRTKCDAVPVDSTGASEHLNQAIRDLEIAINKSGD